MREIGGNLGAATGWQGTYVEHLEALVFANNEAGKCVNVNMK